MSKFVTVLNRMHPFSSNLIRIKIQKFHLTCNTTQYIPLNISMVRSFILFVNLFRKCNSNGTQAILLVHFSVQFSQTFFGNCFVALSLFVRCFKMVCDSSAHLPHSNGPLVSGECNQIKMITSLLHLL